jgi:hypothetical protein
MPKKGDKKKDQSYGSVSHPAIIIGKHSHKADAVLALN